MIFKLPVCPHCGTAYQYNEIKQMKDGIEYCYHCKKKFRIRKKVNILLFIAAVCFLLICADLFVMVWSPSVNIVAMAASNFVVIAAAWLLRFFSVRFIPEKITKSEKKRIKEANEKIHKDKK